MNKSELGQGILEALALIFVLTLVWSGTTQLLSLIRFKDQARNTAQNLLYTLGSADPKEALSAVQSLQQQRGGQYQWSSLSTRHAFKPQTGCNSKLPGQLNAQVPVCLGQHITIHPSHGQLVPFPFFSLAATRFRRLLQVKAKLQPPFVPFTESTAQKPASWLHSVFQWRQRSWSGKSFSNAVARSGSPQLRPPFNLNRDCLFSSEGFDCVSRVGRSPSSLFTAYQQARAKSSAAQALSCVTEACLTTRTPLLCAAAAGEVSLKSIFSPGREPKLCPRVVTGIKKAHSVTTKALAVLSNTASRWSHCRSAEFRAPLSKASLCQTPRLPLSKRKGDE